MACCLEYFISFSCFRLLYQLFVISVRSVVNLVVTLKPYIYQTACDVHDILNKTKYLQTQGNILF